MAKETLSRAQKAQKCFDQGIRAVEIGPNSWQVQGTTGTYNVRNEYDIWSCECSDFHFRGGYVLCWHIEFARLCCESDVSNHEEHECETCERASNHNSPYLTCSWLRAFVQHDKVACDHWLPHSLVEADAQVPDLVVA